MKRVIGAVAQNTRSKKPRLVGSLESEGRGRVVVGRNVMATDIYNYMRKDSLVDFLSMQRSSILGGNRDVFVSSGRSFSGFLMGQGRAFEARVVELLRDRVGVENVVTASKHFTSEGCLRTRELVKSGIPIIYSAPMEGRGGIAGIADLLVRKDWLCQVVDECFLGEEEEDVVGGIQYVVIDIKFSSLPLRSDGVHLLNSGSIPAYKGQLHIYNELLTEVQGYRSRYAYLLGRRCCYTSKGVKYVGGGCFEKLGAVDFGLVDNNVCDDTEAAIEWVRELRMHGDSWSLEPPSRDELRPNMCVDSGIWNGVKEKMACDLGDITMLWNCGVKQREVGIKQGIYSWRDPRCTANVLGINGERGRLLDAMLSINRQSEELVRPRHLSFDLRTESTELFVDFETFSDIFVNTSFLPQHKSVNMIFMIGVGRVVDGVWRQKQFVAEDVSPESERKIMQSFIDYVGECGRPRMYCWYAEEQFWKSAVQRQLDLAEEGGEGDVSTISEWFKVGGWFDLCKFFKEEGIVINGCFSYGLKDVAKAMRTHGLISARMTSNCDSGMTAQVCAWEAYQSGGDVMNNRVLSDIVEYNTFDCKVLEEITEYLRKNHLRRDD